jgi:hypothetical protein
MRWIFSLQERSLFPSLPYGGARRDAISVRPASPPGRAGGRKEPVFLPSATKPHRFFRSGSDGARPKVRGHKGMAQVRRAGREG